MRVPLHDGWMLEAVGGDVPAELRGVRVPAVVPGSVHTDLLRAGRIPDPYLDDHERLLQWVGRTDWRYTTTVRWDPASTAERVDLVCEGLDTVADVELNGTVVARTRNMHRTYRLDVREHLRSGDNTLAVTFGSPIRYADRMSLELGARPHVNHHPFNAIRKMACSFGWDWGPDLATSGVWRPIGLHAWSVARLAAVRPLATVAGTDGRVAVHVDLETTTAAERPLAVRVRVGEHATQAAVEPGATTAVVTVTVPDVALWWPRGHGAQPLYDVAVDLLAGEATPGTPPLDTPPLDTWTGRVGFRDVRLVTEPDEHGTGFTLVVNDRPIFVRGANWIPDDVLLDRVTPERYAARIAQAEEAGLNLLRVWGGGIFESDDFYARCDERGVMVWQDFLFACAAYAEEEPLRGEVVAEARDNVTRLLPHPSLVLWNGNNENIWGHEDWGWKERLDGRTWGMGYYADVLPGILAELDPHRPYCEGSPWSAGADAHPNDPAHGSMHIWDVWNQVDYTVYRRYAPRFVSEFGWQGPPTWATLTRAVSDDPLTPESPGMQVHQKAEHGNRKLEAGLVPHLRVPQTMPDWHWAMSLNQARAIRFGVEHFRSLSPHCMGAVVWQLNDCWPVTSWAAVDGDGRRKPLFYALRQAYAERLLTIQPRDGGLAVVAVNDTDEPWPGTVVVQRRGLDGTVLATADLSLMAPARGTVTLPVPGDVATAGDTAAELATAELVTVLPDRRRAFWFFAEDRDLALPPGAADVRCDAVDGGYRVRVTARELVKDLALLADQVAPDAVVDDMLLTLLPGDVVELTVTTAATVPPEAFTAPAVLRNANQLCRG